MKFRMDSLHYALLAALVLLVLYAARSHGMFKEGVESVNTLNNCENRCIKEYPDNDAPPAENNRLNACLGKCTSQYDRTKTKPHHSGALPAGPVGSIGLGLAGEHIGDESGLPTEHASCPDCVVI